MSVGVPAHHPRMGAFMGVPVVTLATGRPVDDPAPAALRDLRAEVERFAHEGEAQTGVYHVLLTRVLFPNES